ncbi:MAG TPA: C45 family peptidase [Thermoplasmata archaeon]|nr:C45 family peptidase [Thermoplasmata archaeon]
MAGKNTLPVVEASGKPFEMGRIVGRKCAGRAAAMKRNTAAAIKHSTGAEWGVAVKRARKYVPFADEFFPDYIEEVRGYAEGSRLTFEDAFTCCCHELLSPMAFRGCTDIAVSGDVTEQGNTIAAHNEDWSGDGLETVVLLHAKPKGKPEFICTAYGGILPSCGMNSAGVSLTGNALDPNDVRLGIPKIFPVRKVLEAKRIGEAIAWAMPPNRASSYNNICCDKNGEVYSLEGSATDCAWLYADDGYLVHTNHYTSDRMRRFEANPDSNACSIFRYNRARRLVQDQLGSVTVESLKCILRDHVNRPCSICRHPDPGRHPLDVSETIFSVIYDLSSLEAHVLRGKPCSGTYTKYSLQKD